MAAKKEFTYSPFEYDAYQKGEEVLAAEKKKAEIENALSNYGDFAFSKQNDYNSIYDKYYNRKDFSYDFNADALYQQYKDKYIQQGKMAMADTMGQAAAMTGGYGNSYAASVGNQAYQAHLDNLNDVIPELYQMAYDRYNHEGQDMLNKLALLGDERNFEYGQWGDKYNRLAEDRGYYQTEANNAYSRDYGQYSDNRTLAHGEHTNSQGYAYNNYRDAIADEQWAKEYALAQAAQKIADEKWAYEKKELDSYNSPGAATGTNQNKTVTSTKKAEKVKEEFGGYDNFVSELNSLIANGAEKDEISTLLRAAHSSGHISTTEYNKLRATFVPRGYTYR